MNFLEILLLGVGLSMDAFAVTITNVLGYKSLERKSIVAMPIAFGFFQGFMPLVGYFAGSMFASFIEKYAGIVTLLVLGYIGGNMIIESIKALKDTNENEEVIHDDNKYTFKTLIMQAIATSIDAFAVGVSLAALQTNIMVASSIIAITTCLLCFVALYVGKKFGEILGDRAQLLGGIILVFIGIKALL